MSERDDEMPVWSPLQRRLHWLVALLVLGQFALQWPMRTAVRAVERGEAVTFGQFLVTTLHSWGGASIALLVVWRLVLRRRVPVPVAAGRFGAHASRLIGWHHALLYGLLLAMALSGALHYYAGLDAAARWHEVGKWALGAAVALHLAGALVHAARVDDPVLRRMWSGRNGRTDPERSGRTGSERARAERSDRDARSETGLG